METLSCHSKETTWATTIKNINYVEANVMNMYAKFHLHPPYSFWGGDFWVLIQLEQMKSGSKYNLLNTPHKLQK